MWKLNARTDSQGPCVQFLSGTGLLSDANLLGMWRSHMNALQADTRTQVGSHSGCGAKALGLLLDREGESGAGT